MTPELYRGLTALTGPLIGLYLRRRLAHGKEDAARFTERLGRPVLARPPGPLVWMHAASVGEALSVLPLIERILEARSDAHLTLTTGTVTSARLMAERLPARALHQYVPVDRARNIRGFLGHWRPDLAIWAESEFWPNLILEAAARGTPMVLVNARVSARSYRRWRRLPKLIGPLLEAFALCLAQSEDEAASLKSLGAGNVVVTGNLKYDAPPLPVDSAALAAFTEMAPGRPLWLAASTHAGEEKAAGAVHAALKSTLGGLLTVIVPRHPERGAEIKTLLEAAGLGVARRSQGEAVAPETDIYLADTLGELGLFYRAAAVVFVGGSLVRHGGQNPLEPARLDCALLHGPHMENFTEITAALGEANAAEAVADEAALGHAVKRLLGDAAEATRRAEAARQVTRRESGALDRAFDHLKPYLDALPAADHARA